MSAELERPEYRGPNGVLTEPRRIAYRLVGDLVDRHLREHATIDGELRVHLDRIREAMWLAGAGFQDRSSVDPK